MSLSINELEEKIEKEFNIGILGSISAGKSQLLSNIFSGLKYNNSHQRVNKERKLEEKKLKEKIFDPWSLAHEKSRKDMYRINSTDKVESIHIYGIVGSEIIKFNIYSPGAHEQAEKLDKKLDGAIHVVDTNLAAFLDIELYRDLCVVGQHKNKTILDYGIRELLGVDRYRSEESYNIIKILKKKENEKLSIKEEQELSEFKEEMNMKFEVVEVPFLRTKLFYLPTETDELLQPTYTSYNYEKTGLVLDSLFNSDLEVEKLIEEIPIQCALRQAHMKLKRKNINEIYFADDNLSNTEKEKELNGEKYNFVNEKSWLIKDPEVLFEKSKQSFKRALDLYSDFLIAESNTAIPNNILNYEEKYLNKQAIDSAIKDKQPLVRMAHELMAEVVNRNGYKAKDFRLISFGKMNNDYVVGNKFL